jgi:hypothetical protein
MSVLILAATAGPASDGPGPSRADGGRVAADLPAASSAPGQVFGELAAAGTAKAGLGYVWVGYNGATVGSRDFADVSSGDGFTFGAGFRVGATARTWMEVAWEKSLKHDVPPHLYNPVPDPADRTRSGYYERWTFGARSAAAPRARLAGTQPNAYLSYGICYNNLQVNMQTGDPWHQNGSGFYVGLGVEHPLKGRSSFSFDVRHHIFDDYNYDPQDPAVTWRTVNHTTVFSLLLLTRY